MEKVIYGILLSLSLLFIYKLYTYEAPLVTPEPKPVYVEPKIERDPKLVKLLDKLGIKNDKIELVYSDDVPLSGVYLNNKIIVDKSETKQAQMQIVAHEYLHYIWEKDMTNKEKKALEYDLNYAYNASSWIPSRLQKQEYNNCKDSCKFNEIHAYACTSLYDRSLTQKLIDHCNKLIPNRYIITW